MYNDNNDIIMIMCFRINLYKYNSSCFLACWGALNFLPFFFFINNFSLPSSTNVHSSNITHRKPDIKTSRLERKHDLVLNSLERWMFYRFFFACKNGENVQLSLILRQYFFVCNLISYCKQYRIFFLRIGYLAM